MNVKFLGLTLHVEIPELVETLGKLDAKLSTLLVTSASVSREVHHMSAELDALTTTVNDTKTVEDSAIVLLTNLSGLITAAKDDPAALTALAADLKAKSDQLAAAVVANTPAA